MPDGGRTLVYGQLGGNSRAYVDGEGIHVTDEAGLDRVHFGRIGEMVDAENIVTGQYGLRVTNPSGTVIIDGSSDMFRIAATGTINITGPDGDPTPAATAVQVTVSTGLTYTPAFMSFLELLGAAYQMPTVNSVIGSTTIESNTRGWSEVVNTNQTRMTFNWWSSVDHTANTRVIRYYILDQVAI